MNKFDIEFWHTSTKEIFNDSLKLLIEKGFEKNKAVEFLKNLYHAVSNEYGG